MGAGGDLGLVVGYLRLSWTGVRGNVRKEKDCGNIPSHQQGCGRAARAVSLE